MPALVPWTIEVDYGRMVQLEHYKVDYGRLVKLEEFEVDYGE